MITSLLGLFGACTPKPIGDTAYSNKYFYKGSKVYYYQPGNIFNNYKQLPGADRESFQVLYHSVGKDKNNVYYKEREQPQVHYPSFRLHGGHLKDRDKVYQRVAGEKDLMAINNPDIDVGSFVNLDWDHPNNTTYWDKDKNNFYFKKKTLAVDYGTFAPVNANFMTDKNRLYTHLNHWKFTELGALSANFKVINAHTVLNTDTLYYLNLRGERRLRKMASAPMDSITSLHEHIVRVNDVILLYGTPLEASGYDAPSFSFVAEEMFGGQSIYSKDKHRVYLNHDLISDADPDSFMVLESNYSKDDRQAYHKGKAIPNADTATLVSLGWNYAKDANHVYFYGEVLKDADAATFERHPEDPTRFRDKNGDWERLIPLTKGK